MKYYSFAALCFNYGVCPSRHPCDYTLNKRHAHICDYDLEFSDTQNKLYAKSIMKVVAIMY